MNWIRRQWAKLNRAGHIFVVAVVLFVLAVVTASLFGDSTKSDAQAVCRQEVEKRLKAPGTARFSASPTILQSGKDWTIAGQVEATNELGGRKQIGYRCELTEASGDAFRVTDVQFSE